MKVAVTAALLDLLDRHRLSTVAGGGQRWKQGDVVHIHPEAQLEPYAHIFRGDVVPHRLGAFSYSFSPMDMAMSVGRYTSISWSVELMGSAHPADWASTSPFSHNPRPLGGILAYLRDVQAGPFQVHHFDQGPQAVTIGHDVWIGASVMLKRGITIGDGAVIGARSLVTRDVPPYAVVAGSPARIVRHRFADALVERLRRSEWWRFGPDVLQSLDVREPERFLDRLDEARAGGAAPLTLPVLTGQQMIAEAQAA